MSTVRLRRLAADFARLDDYVRRHPRLRMVQTQGDPPERYQIEYQIRSLRMVDGETEDQRTHLVEITLPLAYPRLPPQCRMLSPVFHPNIAPHAICVGDHWTAGESLQAIVIRIGEMLAYQSYNVKSPLNGEAARWVEQHADQVPLDNVTMLLDEGAPLHAASATPAAAPAVRPSPSPASQPAATANPSPAPAAPAPPVPLRVCCPQCAKTYRLPPEYAGRKVRCSGCQTVFEANAN